LNFFSFFFLQQMEAYSPISYRSHRMGMGMAPLPPHSAPTSSMAYNRRRDSINSSIGATSVRRLLAVNRSYGCRHKIPVHVRAKITKHFILLVLAHAITCSALVPFIGLQVSRRVLLLVLPSVLFNNNIKRGIFETFDR
jgi:hypothetical protein